MSECVLEAEDDPLLMGELGVEVGAECVGVGLLASMACRCATVVHALRHSRGLRRRG